MLYASESHKIPPDPCPSRAPQQGMARALEGSTGICQGLKSPIVTKYLNSPSVSLRIPRGIFRYSPLWIFHWASQPSGLGARMTTVDGIKTSSSRVDLVHHWAEDDHS